MFCYGFAKMEVDDLEQRYAIKFCVMLGEGATEAYEKIQKAFGNDSVPRAQVFRWHKDFVNGRETLEDEPRSGRHASVRTSRNVDRVRDFTCQVQRLTIRMIDNELNNNESMIHQIVTQDLNVRKVCARMSPKNLNDDQNARRNEVSVEMLERLETGPGFPTAVITGDESWFFEYELKPKGGVRKRTRQGLQGRRKLP
jgi:hypothetical protein